MLIVQSVLLAHITQQIVNLIFYLVLIVTVGNTEKILEDPIVLIAKMGNMHHKTLVPSAKIVVSGGTVTERVYQIVSLAPQEPTMKKRAQLLETIVCPVVPELIMTRTGNQNAYFVYPENIRITLD